MSDFLSKNCSLPIKKSSLKSSRVWAEIIIPKEHYSIIPKDEFISDDGVVTLKFRHIEYN